MKANLMSREFSAKRVLKGLGAVGICLAGLTAGAVTISYVARAWYDPWRSTRVLQRLNERTQSLDEQLQIINEAMRLDPHSFDARFWYAMKLSQKKDYARAAHAWARVREHPSCPSGILDTAFADQGVCLLFANRPVEAIVYLEETIRCRPDHVTARGFLAAAYADVGLINRECEELMKLTVLKPAWQEEFENCPEYPDEHKAALAKLAPYLKKKGKDLDPIAPPGKTEPAGQTKGAGPEPLN
jgi:tetratricopeptide (TPR) repeat protein